ncbi:hypothetical protein [Chromobacterium violaceum]|uniref:hypothetical protein n=1 Tax=Chromobacterium violaceum TaxID=536 RepID=UPI0009D94FB1|nr:hypothetical protein [Chromobacterium violaceum]OQS47832.1 hypothetical protein B0T48_12170 [Chromobacterium violaceum]
MTIKHKTKKQSRYKKPFHKKGPKQKGGNWNVNVAIDDHVILHIESEKEVNTIKDLIRTDVEVSLIQKPESLKERIKSALKALKAIFVSK